MGKFPFSPSLAAVNFRKAMSPSFSPFCLPGKQKIAKPGWLSSSDSWPMQPLAIKSFGFEPPLTQRLRVLFWITSAVEHSIDNYNIFYDPLPNYRSGSAPRSLAKRGWLYSLVLPAMICGRLISDVQDVSQDQLSFPNQVTPVTIRVGAERMTLDQVLNEISSLTPSE
jgi:hypothetical protein